MAVEDMRHNMYTNQTGQFPVVSSQDNHYKMVLCKAVGNIILVEPMKNKTAGEMSKAYKQFMQWPRSCGIIIRKHILNNKASGDYLQALKK